MQLHGHESARAIRRGDPNQRPVGTARGQIDFGRPKFGRLPSFERRVLMSYYAGDDPDTGKPWFMRKTVWVAAAIIFCLLVLGLGVFTYLGMTRIPEIGGGITIEAD